MQAQIKQAGIIGWPVHHSRSPLIHKFWLAHHQIQGDYVPLPISPDISFRTALDELRARGFVGANVTVPHKIAAFAAADTLDAAAQKIGAVNILHFTKDKIIGKNSDADGFLASLDETYARTLWTQYPVLLLGAGGAARAIVYALSMAGASEVFIANRNFERAENLARAFASAQTKVTPLKWSQKQTILPHCRLLINSTSLGMDGGADLEINLAAMSHGAVMDIVYTPLKTRLLHQATQAGLVAVDGLGMLLHQAVPAFEIWFGRRPAVTKALRHHIEADL